MVRIRFPPPVSPIRRGSPGVRRGRGAAARVSAQERSLRLPPGSTRAHRAGWLVVAPKRRSLDRVDGEHGRPSRRAPGRGRPTAASRAGLAVSWHQRDLREFVVDAACQRLEDSYLSFEPTQESHKSALLLQWDHRTREMLWGGRRGWQFRRLHQSMECRDASAERFEQVPGGAGPR